MSIIAQGPSSGTAGGTITVGVALTTSPPPGVPPAPPGPPLPLPPTPPRPGMPTNVGGTQNSPPPPAGGKPGARDVSVGAGDCPPGSNRSGDAKTWATATGPMAPAGSPFSRARFGSSAGPANAKPRWVRLILMSLPSVLAPGERRSSASRTLETRAIPSAHVLPPGRNWTAAAIASNASTLNAK